MTDIVDLTRVTGIQNDDVIPIFDRSNSATRSVSFEVLRNAVPTIQSVESANGVLTITMTNGTTFTANL